MIRYIKHILYNMDFQNTEIAYKLKSNRQLLKTLFIFRLISNSILVSICTKIITWALRFNLPIFRIFNFSNFSHHIEKFEQKNKSIKSFDLLHLQLEKFNDVLVKEIPQDFNIYETILGEPIYINQFRLSKFIKNNFKTMIKNYKIRLRKSYVFYDNNNIYLLNTSNLL